MTNSRKDLSVFIFAMATLLLSFNTVSSLSILPRITRTDDAIVLDFSDQEYSGPYQGKNLNSELANPGFIPVPQFNPYAMMYQQQPKFSNGWSYFFGYPGLINPAAAPSQRQFDEDDEEFKKDFKDEVVKQGAPTPVPACGTGPSIFPKTKQLLASERVTGIGAIKAKKGAWPFMVGLRKTGDTEIYCTGTLISNSKVLLAAQCLEKLSAFEISGVTVLVGSHLPDLSDVQMTRRISKVIIHSNYNAVTYANDIAVIILDSPVTLSKTVAPVCLPPPSTDPDQYVDQPALILGWGDSGRDGVDILQQGLVAILSNADCRKEAIFGKFVSENSTCVTSAAGDKFTCVVDIGGPVVINTAPATVGTPAIYTIVGINSYTEGCDSTGLKTRVSAYKDWIDKAN